MISTPLAAFGNVVFLVTMTHNEHIDVMLTNEGYYSPGYYYILNGECTGKVLETDELIYRAAGWLNSTHVGKPATPNTTLRCSPVGDSMTWLCIAKKFNNNRLPDVADVILEQGAIFRLLNGTNLLLCTGSVSVEGKVFVAPRQLRIRSGDVDMTSIDKSCSLIFNANK